MTIQTIDKIDMLDFKDLSTIVGGACSFWGATAAVGVGGCWGEPLKVVFKQVLGKVQP